MRLPTLSRGVLTDCRPYQNIPAPVPVKMAGGRRISFAKGSPTPFNPVPVPNLLNASPIQHQLSPSFGAQPATSVSSAFSYSRLSSSSSSSSSSYQSKPPPSITLTSDKAPIPAKLQPSSSSNTGIMSEPLFIVLDFDGTITEEDTLESLSRYAAHYSVIKAYEGKYCPSLADRKPTGSTRTTANDPVYPFGWQLEVTGKWWNDQVLQYTTVLGGSKTSDKVPEPSPVPATSLVHDWRVNVLDPYSEDLRKFGGGYRRPRRELMKLKVKAMYKVMWKEEEDYLESLRTVEENSIKRVEASPIFKGFNPNYFWKFGREAVNGPTEYPWSFIPCLKPPTGWQRPIDPTAPPGLNPPTSMTETPEGELTSVRFRKGFKKFTKEEPFERGEWKFSVLSVNWSQDFIEGVLQHWDGEVNLNGIARITPKPITNESQMDLKINRNESHEDSKLDINKLDGQLAILANHITSQPAIRGPPGCERPLTTAKDKAEVFSWLREHVGPIGAVVYIGDSRTDLLCLRDAQMGIVIAGSPDQSSTISVLRRLGCYVPHVSEAIKESSYAWARDFDEIIDSGILTKVIEWYQETPEN